MTALLQALESGNMSDKEAMAEVAKKIKELELNAGVGVPKETMEYVDLGLPSKIKWANATLAEQVLKSMATNTLGARLDKDL